ncbi:hypothetical protein DFH27DRAFT_273391 [Peziza echinospora]|nr:hypothetical protein DFH27DRAFT_273391 [Peziza echinospora]
MCWLCFPMVWVPFFVFLLAFLTCLSLLFLVLTSTSCESFSTFLSKAEILFFGGFWFYIHGYHLLLSFSFSPFIHEPLIPIFIFFSFFIFIWMIALSTTIFQQRPSYYIDIMNVFIASL